MVLEAIEKVDEIKVSGAIFNEDMTWDEKLQTVFNQISKVLGALCNCRYTLQRTLHILCPMLYIPRI